VAFTNAEWLGSPLSLSGRLSTLQDSLHGTDYRLAPPSRRDISLQHLQSPGSTGSLLRGSLAITTTGLAPASRQRLSRHTSKRPRMAPNGNVAPTQPVLVIRQNPADPTRNLSQMRWGLIPSWSKDMSGAARMINARSETAHVLPAFRGALKHRRCLVPADGFYEWKRAGKTKQPYCLK